MKILTQFIFHDQTLSRNFPIRPARNVGNIRLASGKLASDNSDMQGDDLRRRIRARLDEIGRGPVEAAIEAGLERNYLADILKGKKRSFSSAKEPQVAAALRWSVSELRGQSERTLERVGPKISLIPLLDLVTAGRLKTPSSQIPVEDVPLLAFADLGRGEFFALRVDGDSMDRYSPDGSVIVVNKADRTLLSGKCYVFSHRGQTTYKLWQGGDTPHLAPYSTNPTHRPIFFKKKGDLEVIGRVKRTVLDL